VIDLSLAAVAFGVIFLAELPDKSLFASLVLGTRYPAVWVWLGVTAAFVVHVVIAVAAGGLLDLLPHTVVEVLVALLFALGAVLLLRPQRDMQHDGQDEAALVRARMPPGARPLRVVLTCFGVVFVGEWGDITQVAIANLTAKYHDPLSVGVGSAVALSAVAGLAVRAGSALLARVSVRVVRAVAGSVLAALAALTLVQLVA
jgi:putative Ca2+/H+ antiporter (TMEM165/GDT1 family)